MTPKEKAQELFEKFNYHVEKKDFFGDNVEQSNTKQCALIAVDEIIETEPRYPSNVDWDDVGATHQYYYQAQIGEAARYWQEVKAEIEKL